MLQIIKPHYEKKNDEIIVGIDYICNSMANSTSVYFIHEHLVIDKININCNHQLIVKYFFPTMLSGNNKASLSST